MEVFMNTTVAKTYRLSEGLHSLITQEAETLKCSEADVVRLAIKGHFDRRQNENALIALEERLSSQLDTHTRQIVSFLKQIISLAQVE
jgi:hypothetical protein